MKIHPTLESVRQLGRRGANAAVVRRSTRPPARPVSAAPRARARVWLEGLLVLGMLVSAVLIVRPAFDEAPVTQTLRSGAHELRSLWYRARQHAMTTGSIWQFDYQAGSGDYTVHCVRPGDRVTLSTLHANDRSTSIQGRLADNLSFVAMHASLRPTFARSPLDALEVDHQAIRFFPDGSTSTARVVLRDELDERIELRIMGINGSITVEESRAP